MRIIQISLMTDLRKYEAARTHTLGIAKNLASLGNEVHLIVGGNKPLPNKDRLNVSTLKFNNPTKSIDYLSILSLSIKNNLWEWSFLKKLINYDIIYERFLATSFSSMFFSRIKKIPLIYEVNGIPDEEIFRVFNVRNKFLKKIINSIIKFQLRNSDKIIVQTKELKSIIKKRFNTNNIEVVSNGTDLYDLYNKKKDSIFKICYTGVLDDLHNLDQVFEVTTSLKEKFAFFIVGGGDLFNKYKLAYKKDKRFIFKGQLSHKKALKIIKESDLCIASNSNNYPLFKRYGFYLCPIKLLEYSMAGKPTILFESSNSFTKLFEKNNSCFLVNSEEKFIEKLKFLIKNRKITEKMGRNARKLVEKEFTWIKSAEKTEKILKKVLAEHNKKQ